MVHTIKHTYKNYGIPGFYKGISSLILFNIPFLALRFTSFEFLRNNFFQVNIIN